MGKGAVCLLLITFSSLRSPRPPSVMDLAGSCSSFQSDLDFCPDCGSVLPLPGTRDAVTCARCGFSVHVRGEGCWAGSRLRSRREGSGHEP